MIRSLRKRHRQIWMAWAILLPVGIVFAWLVIPNQSPVKLLKAPSSVLLPVIIKSKEAKDYSINIRSNNENTEWQLEWKNKTVLMVPSAAIYEVRDITDEIAKGRLIGRIETKGVYVFNLPFDSSGYKQLNLVLYDFIHERKIASINLLP